MPNGIMAAAPGGEGGGGWCLASGGLLVFLR